jgi:hypothetical protein
MLWIFEKDTGLRISAAPEDAAGMLEAGTHSCLNPPGSASEEAEMMKKLMAAHNATIPEAAPDPSGSEGEVHVRRRHQAREE